MYTLNNILGVWEHLHPLCIQSAMLELGNYSNPRLHTRAHSYNNVTISSLKENSWEDVWREKTHGVRECHRHSLCIFGKQKLISNDL